MRLGSTAALLGLLALTAPAARADFYVTNHNSDSVSVSIAGSGCGSFTGTVPVGRGPVGVAVSPDGTRAYVANMRDGTVSVIDTARGVVTATVPVGGSPFGPMDVAAHPDGSRVYAVSNNRVSVIDPGSLTVTATVLVVGFAQNMTIHPDGSRLYVTTAASFVEVIDTTRNTVIAHVSTSSAVPMGMAVHPDGTRLYVADGGFVAVMDTASNSFIATVPVEGSAVGVAVHPDGARVYVTNNLNQSGVVMPGKVTVIDAATHAVTFVQDVGRSPSGVAVDRSHVYVANQSDDNVSVFDAATAASVGVVPVGTSPTRVATFIHPLPPALPANLHVTGMEVTQAIQDLANSVTLIAGRRTFVRVHVQADTRVWGVTATLFGVRLRCTTTSCDGVPLGSLVPANAVGTRLTVGPDPKRTNVDDSFLFELPWTWTEGGPLRLHAVVHTPGPAPAPCRLDAPSTTHHFDPPTTLNLRFIRLAYWRAGTYHEASEAEQSQSESWIRRTYPLSELVSGPGLRLLDDGLGSRVDRTARECRDIKEEKDRNQCADLYIRPRLAALSVLSDLGWGDADGGYALIPPSTNGNCKPPTDPKLPWPCFTRGACCTGRIATGPSDSREYAAHEIGHLLGRGHPAQGNICGHDEKDFAYPYALSLIHPLFYDPITGLGGFDGGDSALSIGRASLGDFNGPYDFMGYCGPPFWTSDYTYRNLYSAIRGLRSEVMTAAVGSAGGPGPGTTRVATAQGGDWLTAFGSINSALADPVSMVTRRVDRIFTVPPRTPGNHSIRLIGADGATLADYPFAPEVVEDAAPAGGGPSPLGFGHVVPFVDGTTEVRIVDVSAGDRVLGVKTVSPNPPAVGGVVLQGAPDPATGAVTLEWTAADPDGDPLTFDVFSTRDGGASLQPLVSNLSGTSVEVDTTSLGGGGVQLRVMATDGVHSAFADTAPLSLENKAPRPRILNPGDGTTLHRGQLVNLEGRATDPQDGLIPETGLAWSLPGRALGSGSRLSITDLPVGAHEVTLTATNRLGLSASTTASLVVREVVDLPGPTLTAGPLRIGWHVVAGESQLQTSELEIGNSGGGDLEFTADSNASWLTLSAGAWTAPATLTLTADPGGLADGVTAEASVTVTAVGLAGQAIPVPVTLSVGNTFVVGRAKPEAPPNGPPVANAGEDQATVAGPGCRAQVTLDGTGSLDPDGDPLTYAWTGPFGSAQGPTPAVELPLGSHEVSLTVDDGRGAASSDSVLVAVEDRTPPDIARASATPDVLWPPNHQLVSVDVLASATDKCTAAVCRVTGVSSNEPADGRGDRDTAPDWEIVGPLTVRLRAERAGAGQGRVYTITLECTDHAGNARPASVTVRVPHDNRR